MRFTLYATALLIRLALAIPFGHDWDSYVFAESARNLLEGENPYQTATSGDPRLYPDSDRPTIQQWYAYPPLPLIMFSAPLALARAAGIPMGEVATNLLLKLPFIAGDLLAAWLVWKFLEPSGLRIARRGELLVLFNPLLIWISSAWGMFDIWMANFLLLALLVLRRGQTGRAGVFLAAACTTKLFPVFFLPAIAAYVAKTQPGRNLRLFVLLILAASAVTLPFFLSSPRGFLNQNLLMHLIRPPQGISIWAFWDYYANIYRLPSPPISLTTAVGAGVIITTIILSTLRLLRASLHTLGETDLIRAMTIVFVGILLVNKVTNEQYFVLLVVLLILLVHLTPNHHRLVGAYHRLLTFATLGALTASVLLGFHFLSFLLPKLTQATLGTSTNHLVFYLSQFIGLPRYAYPDSVWTFYHLPMALTTVAMAPFTLLGGSLLLRYWVQTVQAVQAVRTVFVAGARAQAPLRWWQPLAAFFLAGALPVVIFLAPSWQAYLREQQLFEPIVLVDEREPQSFPATPRVGVFYNVWWNNFSHDPAFAYGDWPKATLSPLAGYYTSKNSYYAQHIRQMKQAGIDFALVSYHLYDRQRYLTFGNLAEKLGLYYAPMVELYDVLAFNRYRPTGPDGQKILGFAISDKSQQAAINVIISALADNASSPAILRIDQRPVVALFYGHWFLPSWDSESKLRLAQRVVDLPGKPGGEDLQDVIRQYPATLQEFNSPSPAARAYRQAFLLEYQEFWASVRREVETKIGPVFLLSTYPPFDPDALRPASQDQTVIQFGDLPQSSAFDGEFFYGISSTWYSWRPLTDDLRTIKQKWEEQVLRQATRDRHTGWPTILTVIPAYNESLVRPYNPYEPIPPDIDGENTYDWSWKTALKHYPDMVLITSWNEFFEGTAIEPTQEYGDVYLKKTSEWAAKFSPAVAGGN